MSETAKRLTRIAVIGIKSYPPAHGDMETMTAALIDELIRRDCYDITVYVLRSSGLLANTPNLRVKLVRHIKVSRLKTVVGVFDSIMRLRRDMPDIVHVHGLENAFFLPLLRFFNLNSLLNIRGTKWSASLWDWSVSSCLNFLMTRVANVVFSVNLRFFARFASKIVTVNDYSLKAMPRSVKEKVSVVFNALRLTKMGDKGVSIVRKFNLIPQDYIIFVGRLVPLKGVHYLIRAFKQLDLPCRLVVVGDIMDTNPYHQYLRDCAKDAKIDFLGKKYGDDAYALIENAKLLVLPSETEGMAVTILEAVLLETPLLASDIPENAHLWRDNIFYFKNKNIDDLASTLHNLMTNDELRLSKVQNALTYANQKFNFEDQMDTLMRVYHDLSPIEREKD